MTTIKEKYEQAKALSDADWAALKAIEAHPDYSMWQARYKIALHLWCNSNLATKAYELLMREDSVVTDTGVPGTVLPPTEADHA